MLFAAGIGALIGCARPHTASQSIGGFGMACLAAALVVTLPAIAIAGAASQPGLLWILTACAAMSTVGGATTYGRKALLHRVASRSSTGATMLARTFVYVGMTVWILAPTALRLTGKPTTLLMPALLLTVLGIALRTRDPMAVDPADS